MRIICVYFPHLPYQVEKQDNGLVGPRQVVIGGPPHERKPVYALSPSASRHGVHVGMSLRHAYSLCPDALFLPADKQKYEQAFEETLNTMDGFSPIVEKQGLDTAYIGISGMESYYLGEMNLAKQLLRRLESEHGLKAVAGIADNKFVARVAAVTRNKQLVTAVPSGKERAFLADMPVDILPCSEDMKWRVHLLGIKTAGKLADLGPHLMMAQFGREGMDIYNLACGIDISPVISRRKPGQIEEEVDFESPAGSVEEVLKGLQGPLDRALKHLEGQWLLPYRVDLELKIEDGASLQQSWDLKTPACCAGAFLSLIRQRLEQARLDSPVTGAVLVLSDLRKDGRQLSLSRERPGRGQIAPAVREITSRWGKGMVKKAAVLQPGAFLPEQQISILDF